METEHGAVRSRLWRHGALEQEDFPFEKISDYLEQDGCLVWIDICDPNPSLLQDLAKELFLDPHAVEDSLSRVGRAKATRFPTHLFLTVYATILGSPDAESRSAPDLNVTPVSAFVLRRAIVTVRHGNEFDIDEVVSRWDDNSDLLKFGVSALVYGLLDMVVDGHFEAVQVIDDSIEDLEDDLFDDLALNRELQRRTYQVRKDLVQLRRVVLPMREVVNSVLRHRQDLGVPSELDGWYDDLYDHVLRASEWTESLRDMISTVFETNLSLQDARLNTVMKKLTGWAAIIAVPTAVTGYFGQNVPYPGFASYWGWLFSCSVILGGALSLYIVFRRKGWI